MRVAFINSIFPQLSQTFVLDQIDYALANGDDAVVFCSRRVRNVKHAVIDRWNLYDSIVYAKPRHARTVFRVLGGILLYPNRLLKYLARGKAMGAGDREFFFALQAGRRPDVIVANFGPNGITSARIKRLFFPEARLVVIFHGYDLSSYTRTFGWDAYREAAPFIDLAVCVNRPFQERLVAGVGSINAIVHHLGVPLERLPQHRGHPGDEFAILFVGRMVEKKGFKYVLEAARMLAARGYRIRLHAIGDGAEPAEIAEIQSGEMGDGIVLYGGRDHEFVLKMMTECDCLVAPSVVAEDGDQEGIPITIMEAMAIGLPVVSTYHSGIPELVEPDLSGLLVEERDAKGLAEAIASLIESPDRRRQLAEAARRRVETHFNAAIQNKALFQMVHGAPTLRPPAGQPRAANGVNPI